MYIYTHYIHIHIKKKNKTQEHAGIWCSHRELSKPITIQSIHSQCKLFLKTILAQNVFIYVNCVWIDFSVGLLFCSIRRVLHASTASFQFDNLCVYRCVAGWQWRRTGENQVRDFLKKFSLEQLENEWLTCVMMPLKKKILECNSTVLEFFF